MAAAGLELMQFCYCISKQTGWSKEQNNKEDVVDNKVCVCHTYECDSPIMVHHTFSYSD